MEQYELEGLRSAIVSRLVRDVGPLANVIVDELIESINVDKSERLSPMHIVAVIRQLQNALPTSVDKESLIKDLRNELLAK